MPAKRQPATPRFTGPRETIFVYERRTDSWLISAWDGSEARVPRRDLEEFIGAYRTLRRTGEGDGAD